MPKSLTAVHEGYINKTGSLHTSSTPAAIYSIIIILVIITEDLYIFVQFVLEKKDAMHVRAPLTV